MSPARLAARPPARLLAWLLPLLLLPLAVATSCRGPSSGQRPELVTEPADILVFGNVQQGASQKQPLTVKNVGTAELILFAVRLRNAESHDFTLDPATLPAFPARLPPSSSTILNVVYTPSPTPAGHDELEITSNDPLRPTLVLPVEARATGAHLRFDPAEVDFGLVENHAGPVRLKVTNDGTAAVLVDQVGTDGPELSATTSFADGTELAVGQSFEVDVSYTFKPEGSGSGRLLVVPRDRSVATASARLLGPPAAIVPAEVRGKPLEKAVLDGSKSRAPGNAIASYTWTVVSQPDGSQTAGQFAAGQAQTAGRDQTERCPAGERTKAQPCFFPDVPGDYLFALVIRDHRSSCPLAAPGSNCKSATECCAFLCETSGQCGSGGVCSAAGGCDLDSKNQAQLRLRALPDQGLFVTLSWDSPADLDLHMVRDSGQQRAWLSIDDCYWKNPNPDWGDPDQTNGQSCQTSSDCTHDPNSTFTTCKAGPDGKLLCFDGNDDPRSLIDDVKGIGPEAIAIRLPKPDLYHLGVHYFPSTLVGERHASLRVYVLGEEVVPQGSSLRVTLRENDFWYAAVVDLRDIKLPSVQSIPVQIGVNPAPVSGSHFPPIP